MVKDYYAALGIASDADQEVIKAAFRALAKKYHPDTAADPGAAKARFPEIAKARFREINEAHAVLSNPAARAEYNRLLARSEKTFASNSREPERLAERAETSKRRAPPSFAHRVSVLGGGSLRVWSDRSGPSHAGGNSRGGETLKAGGVSS